MALLDTLISSKTRLKLLLKFFLNSNNQDYLRGLEAEFGESSNAIRIELNRLEESGLLKAHYKGNRKFFTANEIHPFHKDINSLIRKYVGLDTVIDEIVEKIGDLKSVYLSGKLAQGIDSKLMDLLFIGNLDKMYLSELIRKVEILIEKKIRFVVCSLDENRMVVEELIRDKAFLIWGEEVDLISWGFYGEQ